MTTLQTLECIGRPSAVAGVAGALESFDELLAKLHALRAQRFGASDDFPDWGDVGSICYVNTKLREALEHYNVETL